jgi:hypothetical protein
MKIGAVKGILYSSLGGRKRNFAPFYTFFIQFGEKINTGDVNKNR